MRPLAYTYDAAVHCTACATARFGGAPPHGDEVDREGNHVGIISDIDSEWLADAARACKQTTLACDDCFGVIAYYDPELDIEFGPAAP